MRSTYITYEYLQQTVTVDGGVNRGGVRAYVLLHVRKRERYTKDSNVRAGHWPSYAQAYERYNIRDVYTLAVAKRHCKSQFKQTTKWIYKKNSF